MQRIFDEGNAWLQDSMEKLTETVGQRPKLLVAKLGLDGHSNGAEQIALSAREAGFNVLYPGIRSTPEEIVRTAEDEGVNIIGISMLSGSHNTLIPLVLEGLKKSQLEVPVVAGGIIPKVDAEFLLEAGVEKIYTPADYRMSCIMSDLVTICERAIPPTIN